VTSLEREEDGDGGISGHSAVAKWFWWYERVILRADDECRNADFVHDA
jgi:hypothetical protein